MSLVLHVLTAKSEVQTSKARIGDTFLPDNDSDTIVYELGTESTCFGRPGLVTSPPGCEASTERSIDVPKSKKNSILPVAILVVE